MDTTLVQRQQEFFELQKASEYRNCLCEHPEDAKQSKITPQANGLLWPLRRTAAQRERPRRDDQDSRHILTENKQRTVYWKIVNR